MPGRNFSLIGHNMWHSGLVTFVAIDTETNIPHSFFPESNFKNKVDQSEWLSDTLSKINKKKTPWVVVGHRPIYSSQNIFSAADESIIGESKILQEVFEDILYKYHVNIAMFGKAGKCSWKKITNPHTHIQMRMHTVGHVHSNERTNPVYRTLVEPNFVFHFHIGIPFLKNYFLLNIISIFMLRRL
ncbi:hypothetical protein FDP41_002256 [Naegleria fowleri]|uniref:Calcineurin-like phosphoesterase domain-containing protein n=1 Tax=Naegleria fowleri TaxID=5763 RepID=A0A6A5BTB3_NAEFO|nr:uncharacterized protein FDP41_002256 [Naegleria fowleri]KAF0978436.1 hypothetical protein FDP41_002256 [Naegleria fowleri]